MQMRKINFEKGYCFTIGIMKPDNKVCLYIMYVQRSRSVSPLIKPLKVKDGLTFLFYLQVPLLEAGDIIIDGGNSEYRDSIVSK